MSDGALVGLVILGWALANGLPHLVVYQATRHIYYQLPSLGLVMIAENSITLLNLGAALLIARVVAGERSLWDTLGWRFDAEAVFWGLAGFAAMTIWPGLVNRLTPRQIVYGPMSARCGRAGLAFASISLVLLPAFCEETMFRGLIQGEASRILGPGLGIALAALLFGLRHLPADLHWARVHGAGWPGWLNRVLELYGGAVILGFARYLSESTFAAWIAHQCAAMLIVKQFLPTAGRGRPETDA
ncbi:hypothetical protein AMK68_02040 [candidate division KD3-62 bacterium DG_56]|uniref:CAAX prenyl protease 2/Lysostaphin resistance protein A-like domain-containing protein n=1 Tax=candidate division KD3-62 bacterium DG_56 TaxID=1704032 RepID=A0A0S7XQW1_9BACT|nr:MAG: hypothetical protein AMK68_02040 [candidate division KD3-62 bacterium DG_56]